MLHALLTYVVAQHALMLERRRPCHIVCQIYAYSLRFLGHNIPNSGVSTY